MIKLPAQLIMINNHSVKIGKEMGDKVESGKAIAEHFKDHINYINVLKNISVDCDCDAHGAPPKCEDIRHGECGLQPYSDRIRAGCYVSG